MRSAVQGRSPCPPFWLRAAARRLTAVEALPPSFDGLRTLRVAKHRDGTKNRGLPVPTKNGGKR